MPLIDYGEAVYGLRELQVAPYVGGALGAWMNLPGLTLTYRLVREQSELRSNDQVVATTSKMVKVEWEIDAGPFPMEVINAMYGGTLTTTGSSPNEEKELKFSVEDDTPDFAIRGRAVGGKTPPAAGGGAGGDMVLRLNWCQVTGNLEGSMQDQNWMSPKVSGVCLEHPTDGLMSVITRETAAAFAA
jgi:hypothetical protein